MEEKKDINTDLAAQSGAASETVDRYGSAIKEHHVAYSGEDREFGRTLKRGLKKTSQSKVSSEYKKQNLKQQAGFAAEDKYTARQNAEKIIKGSKQRYSRTDDVGKVNDQLYDHIRLDENGVEIIGSGEQMKFVGNSPVDCLAKLKSSKYQKYIDADATLTVPSDYYNGIKTEIDCQVASLNNQLDYARERGNTELTSELERKIVKLHKIKKNLKDSGITNKEALEARFAPKLSTAKDIVKLGHRAGVEQAKTGAIVGGGISLIRNVVGVCKGDITPTDAAKNVVTDTGKGALIAYGTAFAGSAIKGTMQNASNSVLRAVSKTNAPTVMVTSILDIGKSIVHYTKGEITGLECLEELGEKGTANVSAALFATIGQATIPVPVVGAMVGSMIGYALSSAFYRQLTSALKEEQLSYERRLKAEKESEEAIAMMEEYWAEAQIMLKQYFYEYKSLFDKAFQTMDIALKEGDIDAFICGANAITKKMGGNVEFSTFYEFDQFMKEDTLTLKL
ncbi:MAG: hypothetical protein J1E57_11875 [Prevotella sp.]|nr:hypothetical protein [Prevotella sp.]